MADPGGRLRPPAPPATRSSSEVGQHRPDQRKPSWLANVVLPINPVTTSATAVLTGPAIGAGSIAATIVVTFSETSVWIADIARQSGSTLPINVPAD